jgi:hypothetical protein
VTGPESFFCCDPSLLGCDRAAAAFIVDSNFRAVRSSSSFFSSNSLLLLLSPREDFVGSFSFDCCSSFVSFELVDVSFSVVVVVVEVAVLLVVAVLTGREEEELEGVSLTSSFDTLLLISPPI